MNTDSGSGTICLPFAGCHFFDPEENTWLEQKLEEQNRLSLVVTSVERDLRVQVVNYEGEPVTGRSFIVELGDQGSIRTWTRTAYCTSAD